MLKHVGAGSDDPAVRVLHRSIDVAEPCARAFGDPRPDAKNDQEHDEKNDPRDKGILPSRYFDRDEERDHHKPRLFAQTGHHAEAGFG